MFFEVRSSASIIFAMLLCLSLPSSVHAEGKKKIGTEKFEQEETKWKGEPSSFFDIKLNQPLNSSVSLECPKKTIGQSDRLYADHAAIKAMPDGIHCYLGPHKYIQIYGINVPPLDGLANVLTDNEAVTGNVIRINSVFRTSNFELVKSVFISKYGAPHKQEISKFKTQGGAEFDSYVLNWRGSNVNIDITSLNERYFNSDDLLVEYGLVSLTTKSYRDKIEGIIDRSVRESASKL